MVLCRVIVNTSIQNIQLSVYWLFFYVFEAASIVAHSAVLMFLWIRTTIFQSSVLTRYRNVWKCTVKELDRNLQILTNWKHKDVSGPRGLGELDSVRMATGSLKCKHLISAYMWHSFHQSLACQQSMVTCPCLPYAAWVFTDLISHWPKWVAAAAWSCL